MTSPSYQIFADAVLVLHFGVVLFIVGGLVLVVIGNLRNWRWVNNVWLRAAHLAAIAVVAAQSLIGAACPLTTFESWLRIKAGASPYAKGFIEHWVQKVLFYEAPLWVFAAAYAIFGVLVVVAWWRSPPRRGSRAHLRSSGATRKT